jgi:hypothetical protein
MLASWCFFSVRAFALDVLALARQNTAAISLEISFPFVRFSRVAPAPYDPSLFLLKYLPALYLLLLVEAFPQH